jgi:uncharacterized protein DUF4350
MSYRLEIGLALLLAGAIGVAVVAAGRTPKPQPADFRASTLLTGPRGSKALYEVLIRLGRPVQRRRTPLFDLAVDTVRRPAPALLVVLNPPIHLQPAELEQVVRFVQGGGAVLAAGTGGGITGCAGWDADPPTRRFAVDSVPVRAAEGLRLPSVARVLVWRRAGRGLEGLVKRRNAKTQDDPCGPLVARGTDTLLATTDGRPVVVRTRYAGRGGGTITLAADAGWFRNKAWRDTDVPYVVLPLLTPTGGGEGRGRGRVVWDEYHQGFGRVGSSVAELMWEWLRSSPAGWAILQLVAVALIWLAVTAVRFGPARSVIERRRRSPLEHLEALAAGLESAAGVDTAVQRMVSGLRRRLSRAGHVGTGDLEPWLASLELAMPTARGRGVVRRLHHIMTERGGFMPPPERVLAAAQTVEDVWEELRPRTTRDAF